jgi:hypothetical protein
VMMPMLVVMLMMLDCSRADQLIIADPMDRL